MKRIKKIRAGWIPKSEEKKRHEIGWEKEAWLKMTLTRSGRRRREFDARVGVIHESKIMQRLVVKKP